MFGYHGHQDNKSDEMDTQLPPHDKPHYEIEYAIKNSNCTKSSRKQILEIFSEIAIDFQKLNPDLYKLYQASN